MKLYTRSGDTGSTQLVGGKKVDKFDLKVECYGTIDELNSWVGLTISKLNSTDNYLIEELIQIQNELFDLGTDLATPVDSAYKRAFSAGKSQWLEQRIDAYSAKLPEIRQFILPGGTQAASSLQVARTITRRSERLIAQLSEQEVVTPEIMKYINRLSDYFFVAARWVNHVNKVEERFYQNNLE